MGTRQTVKIGPYLEVTGKVKIEEELRVLTCSNSECVKHKKNEAIKTNCCPECGTKTSIKQYINIEECDVNKYVCNYDESNIFEDNLISYNYLDGSILLPNEAWTEKNMGFDSYESGVIDLNDVDSKTGIEWFEKKYDKQIEILKKIFGEEVVKVKFGLISYCN